MGDPIDDDAGGPLKGKARHVWESTILRAVAKPGHNHLLHALLRYAGGKHECWPSNETLSAETGLSERWVRRLIGEMAAAGTLSVVPDRSLRTQRRLAFPSHPNAPRGGLETPPALSAGGSLCVGAGGASRPPETKGETNGREEGSQKRGSGEDEGLAPDAQGDFAPSPIACVEPMAAPDAGDRRAVEAWARSAWLALAPGRECETVDDLVRIAAARDGARLGLDAATVGSRRRWVEKAIEDMRAPA